MKHNDEAALIREVKRQIDQGFPGYAWIRVGKGQTFHRTTVRRAIARDRLTMLSYGRDHDGVYGFQITAVNA